MNFDQFIKRLPELKRATTQEDSRKILAFLKNNASPQKNFTLFYDRSPNFFSLCELSSPHFFVLYFEDETGETQGVISYTLLKSQGFDTLYVGDLKIKAKAEETKKKWRMFAEDFIENLRDIDEFKNVKFIHMVMMDDNTKAYKRLVASNLLTFKYQKVHSYKMVNILASKWWKNHSSRSFQYTVYENDQNRMFNLIQNTHKNKFASNHEDLIQYRAEKIVEMAKILEVKDQQGIVLLRASLEDVSQAKRILIKRLPLSLKAFSVLSSIFGNKKYSENQALNILYFSNLEFHSSVTDNPKQMADVLSYALKMTYHFSKKDFHLISLSLFPQEEILLNEIQKYFVTNIESLGFYQILPSWGDIYPKTPLPNFNMSYI
jgi:hypothetical protein